MLSRFLALAALAVWTSTAALAADTVRVQSLGPVHVGQPVPSFASQNDAGALVSTSRMFGQPLSKGVVISVFATWCGPCKEGLPVINDVVKQRTSEWDLLLIDYEEPPAKVRAFMRDMKLDASLIIDSYGKVCQKFGVDKTLPKTFVIDKKGVVLAIFAEEGKDFGAQLESVLDSASNP